MSDSDTHVRPHEVAPDEREDAFAARIAAPLRAPEPPDPALAARVLAAIDAGAEPRIAAPVEPVADRAVRSQARATVDAYPAATGGPRSWRATVTVGVVPLVGLLLAACLALVVLVGDATPPALPAGSASTRPQAQPHTVRVDTVHLVRFVLIAPDARSVSLVGDFNGWDRTVMPLKRAESRGVWTATVALPEGRHEYAFLVDGDRWTADPNAAGTVEDEFGVASSVLTVGSPRATRTRRT